MNKKTEKKIKDLFKYRKLPVLFKLAGTSKKKEKDFYNKLMKLQSVIYDLDLYLESNWKLKDDDIDGFWKNILAVLSELGVPKKDHQDYVKQILKYQKHEIAIRNGKFPSDYTMEYFYYYKSCDVKLIRRLIYDKHPSLNQHFKLSDWRLFDLITEVVDDLQDIEEDTLVYNGNRFLISTIVKKKKASFRDFDLFLNDIDKRLENEKWDNDMLSMIKEWTIDGVNEADNILDELALNFPKGMIKKSKLAKKIKK